MKRQLVPLICCAVVTCVSCGSSSGPTGPSVEPQLTAQFDSYTPAAGSILTSGSMFELAFSQKIANPQGAWSWAHQVLFVREDGRLYNSQCGTSFGTSAGGGAGGTMSDDSRLYQFSKGHTLNAIGLAARTDTTITGRCYFGGAIGSAVNPDEIAFDKAKPRIDLTLNWRVE